MSDLQHGDRVEYVQPFPAIELEEGSTGTVTHLNGDGVPGTQDYWANIDGNKGVWIDWDHTPGEKAQSCWTPTDCVIKL